MTTQSPLGTNPRPPSDLQPDSAPDPGAESPGPRQQQAIETRRHLATTAMVLFSQRGYSATSTRRIAEAAGVSEGLIFHHFPSKVDLLRAIPEHHTTFSRELATIVDGAADRPVSECLAEVVHRFTALMRDQGNFVLMMLAESRKDEVLRAVLDDMVNRGAGPLTRYLEARIAAGELRADLDPAVAGAALLGSLLFFLITGLDLSDDDWTVASQDFGAKTLDLWLTGALAKEARS